MPTQAPDSSLRQKRNGGDLVAIIFRSSRSTAYCGSHEKPTAFAAVLIAVL